MAACGVGLESTKEFAEQGNVEDQLYLGVMYENGNGVPKDDAEAVRWYRKGAEQVDAYAQVQLGFIYAIGSRVPKNNILAHKWSNPARAGGGWLRASSERGWRSSFHK